MLSSNGFRLAKTPLYGSWLVPNLKHWRERTLLESGEPFLWMERASLSTCWSPGVLRVVSESFRNSWIVSVFTSKSLSLKTPTVITSPVEQDSTSILKAFCHLFYTQYSLPQWHKLLWWAVLNLFYVIKPGWKISTCKPWFPLSRDILVLKSLDSLKNLR